MLRIKHNTYPSLRIAFVMSSTFFLVSTKIIILFPLSTPSSLRSLDNLGKKKKKRYNTTMKLHKLIRCSAIGITRGTCNLNFNQTTVEMKLNSFTFFHLHKRSSARNLQSSIHLSTTSPNKICCQWM